MSNNKYTVEIADSTGHSVVEMTKQEILSFEDLKTVASESL